MNVFYSIKNKCKYTKIQNEKFKIKCNLNFKCNVVITNKKTTQIICKIIVLMGTCFNFTGYSGDNPVVFIIIAISPAFLNESSKFRIFFFYFKLPYIYL